MKSLLEQGGTAFPTRGKSLLHGDRALQEPDAPGMTLRDYFAASMLNGVMAQATNIGEMPPDFRAKTFAGVAEILYALADAMLAERAK